MKHLKSFLVLCLFINSSIAQEVKLVDGGEYISSEFDQCLSDQERLEISTMLEKNIHKLEEEGVVNHTLTNNNRSVSFDWPLRKKPDLKWNSYYATNNFVDQKSGSGLLDYNCGARTYDGHRGTDYDTWPFPWYIYQNDLVEVIAAEEGTIIGKIDGHEDDHCSCSGNWNAVFIMHADGSQAWYGHLKSNSLLSKNVGQTVEKGEYLGVVASSGCSSQPHLHFEVYDQANNLIDPYQGDCNSLNDDSYWTAQKPYQEPTLNALLTHDEVPILGCPLENEQTHFSNSFSAGQKIYTAIYLHDEYKGGEVRLRIRFPNNNTWVSWEHISPANYTKSHWLWIWILPLNAPSGIYKFEVEYNEQIFVHEFKYNLDPIPSLSEWGLFILFLFLTSIGLVYLRYQSMIRLKSLS